jgi:hypothetical protein
MGSKIASGFPGEIAWFAAEEWSAVGSASGRTAGLSEMRVQRFAGADECRREEVILAKAQEAKLPIAGGSREALKCDQRLNAGRGFL